MAELGSEFGIVLTRRHAGGVRRARHNARWLRATPFGLGNTTSRRVHRLPQLQPNRSPTPVPPPADSEPRNQRFATRGLSSIRDTWTSPENTSLLVLQVETLSRDCKFHLMDQWWVQTFTVPEIIEPRDSASVQFFHFARWTWSILRHGSLI